MPKVKLKRKYSGASLRAFLAKEGIMAAVALRRRDKRQREAATSLALAYLGAPSVDVLRLEGVIKRHVDRVFEATDGNLSLAAKLLGMHRRTLQRFRKAQVRRRHGRGGRR